MRLPYLQVATEVIEQAAPDVAVLLGIDEYAAGWGLVRLIKWAVGRCPDDSPPSANAVVRGAIAARLIAGAAGYQGDPEAFVTACEQCKPAMLERVEGGVRIRGLDRYDAAWGKNHPAEWKAWKEKQATTTPATESAPTSERNRNETGPEPERNRAEVGTEPARKTQTQTQTHSPTSPSETSEREGGAPLLAAEPQSPAPSGQASLLEQPSAERTPPPEALQELWNEHPLLPRWREMPKPRREAAVARLRERPVEGPQGWREVVGRIAASAFCRGTNDRGWRADPEFLLRPGTAAKVLEGKYDDRATSPPKQPQDVRRGVVRAEDALERMEPPGEVQL